MLKKILPMAIITSAIATSCDNVEITDLRIARYQGDRSAAISFTFDDGMLCQYTDIAPQLEKNDLRGTFWIIGKNMDSEAPDYPWMTWQQVADLARRGHEISNHSWSHPNLTSLTEEELRWEVTYNDSVIQSVTGQKPRTFCYPYNAMNDLVIRVCSEGRVGTRTFQEAQGQKESHQTAESMTAWLNKLIQDGEWGVTMTHGTTYGWDMWDEPELLYAFFAEVKAASDSVWAAPFANASAYIAERDDAELSWTSGNHAIVITPMLKSLDPAIFDEPLTLRIDGTFQNIKPSAQQGSHTIEIKNYGTHILLDAVPNGEDVIIKW